MNIARVEIHGAPEPEVSDTAIAVAATMRAAARSLLFTWIPTP
jgi:hypothetical protein